MIHFNNKKPKNVSRTERLARNGHKLTCLQTILIIFLAFSGISLSSQPIIDLGMANQFAIVGRQVHLHNADVFGNAAVGNNDACSPAPSYNMKFESPGVLHGIAYTEEGALLAGETSNALGGIVLADAMVVQAFSEAMDAYNTAITLIPDQTITGNISSTTTITATHGGQYVIRITGDITKSLILNPAPGTITKFIVIVEGTINLGGSDTVGASGPAGASDVLIVIEGAGNDLKSHVDNKVYGTMLAPYRGAEFHGFAGAMISGCEYVKFQSDAQLEYHGYQVNDWGDAPDSYGTRFASDGPRHVLNPYLWLGATIDPDNDGQPTVDADGDDLNGTPDDEDGLSLPLEFVQGTAANVDVSVFNTTGQTATLVGYLDLNGDGDFLDSGDKKSTTIPHSSSGISTTVTLTWDIPTGAPSTTYARFRLSTNATAIGQPTGAAPDGEIEDYSVTINEPSSLGDRIWYDRDKDGIQDDGEPGIDGVTVKLHKSDGTTLVSTTTSSGGGAYLFDNLTPDDYIVEFVPPSGFTLALQHQGVDETLDSDADPTTGRTQLITLTSGQSNLTIDAGLHNGIYFPDDSCLGEAGTFAIFGVEGGSIIINSATDLIGDVGYSANLTSTTNAKAGDDGLFNGTVWVHGDVAAFAYSDKDFLPQGGIAGYPTPDADINARLDEANDDALYAWTSYGNSAPDIQLGVLGDNDSRTVNRVDNITVVEITSLDYNSDVLELIGLAGMDDAFIINVLGDFQFSQSEIRLTNVRPERVVFNFPNVSDILINKDASIFMGTILAPTSDMEYHNPATFEGAIVAKNINVHSDFNLTHKPLDIPCEENELDFGDAPDTGAGTASGNYNTLFADNGPRHIIVPNLRLGDDVDAETDGYQSTNANGDDTHNRDDEDGVLTSLVFARGETAAVDISVYNTTGQTATLVGYMDLNGDGDFLDANEKQTTTIPHSSGGTSVTVTLSWPVPQDAPLTTYARFRVSTDAAAAEQPTGLAPNGEVEDYLATIVESASLGNYIWDDLNNDGIQDAGEPGVDGVTVNLYKSDGTTLLGTTTTAGGGIYGFANLAPGDYIVEFVAPVGWGFTKQDQGSDDTKDSDADPTTGRSHIVSLDAGENDPTIDAGLVELGSIAGTVWEDTDKDGIYQSGESPLPNLTITLYDSDDNVVATTTTDANGNYLFPDLPADDYYVQFTTKTGYSYSPQDQGTDDTIDSDANPITGQTDIITLARSEDKTDIDAGQIPNSGAIGDYVWSDENNDGIQDSGETGIPNVTVRLLDDSNTLLATTTTDEDGLYYFTGLAPDDYKVQFVKPDGYAASPQDQGSDDTKDSDADPVTGRTGLITLSAGEIDPTVDAGLFGNPASIGDYVWNDLNSDGIQDAGETGVNGVTVRLYKSDGTTLVGTTTTASGGIYGFANLAPGDYIVQFIPPAGMGFTLQDQGGDDTKDSDANPTTGRSHVVSLAAGENDPTIDAGLVELGSIAGTVWEDTDKDGIQDTGEPPLPNLTVTLYDSDDNVVATTTTDENGEYLFPDLPADDYYVQFTTEDGYSYSPQDQGADDTIDSDANPITGQTDIITLARGEDKTDVDAGQIPNSGAIGDVVWSDADNDGIQDTGETGIPNVTVRLLDDSNTLLATTTTDADGLYYFTGLAPDDYKVQFVKPDGYAASPQDQGGDDTKDSDANPTTGRTDLTTISAGEIDSTIDAGFFGNPASLGNYVWDDLNNDGIQDAGEPGVNNITVRLYKSDGTTLVGITVTAGGGLYSFTNLSPGDYIVQFVPPTGWGFTKQDQGGDDAKDSDANPTTGRSHIVSLTAGENNPTIDAGLVELGSIDGTVWEDTDKDGIQDAGEPPLPNLTVTLYDSDDNVVATTTTDANGNYLFPDLPADDYYVQFTTEDGYSYSPQDQGADDTIDSDANPITGQTDTITLARGEDKTDVDAGQIPNSGAIGDVVWSDENNDGIQDSGETGIPNVTVRLLDDSNTPLATTTTDADGLYYFTGLAPDDYKVEFVKPNGYAYSPQDQGGDDTKDSDADPVTGRTGLITLSAGEIDPTIDAGFYGSPASLGDYIWDDLNNSGIQDAGEPGVNGVTVRLYKSDGTTLVGTTTTAGGGIYGFANLAPGDYIVEFVPPAGMGFTLQDQGSDDTKDSDANPTTGRSHIVSLTAGENDPTIDAGLVELGSIAGTVWEDADKDGIYDPSESPLPNLTVTLTDGDGDVLATTTTNANGDYLFSDLPAGDYFVEFSKKSGYSFSPKDQGSDDTVDSDANPITGRADKIVLARGEDKTDVDAGQVPNSAALGDFVWSDTNDNGIQESGEYGIAGVTVRLLDAGENTLAETTTNNNGLYYFTGLAAGSYKVYFAKPSGHVPSPQNAGDDDTKDSDAGETTGISPLVSLAAGAINPTIDAGFYPNPIAIELTHFAALGQANGITIEWQTALEIDIAGYNLYHSAAENGEYSKMNKTMITASGKSDGAAYSFSYKPDHDGLHYFKLQHVGLDGTCEFSGPVSASFVTGVTVATSEIPQEFSLAQNYPNPFNPSTSIAFALPTQEFVTITIFDGRGRVVKSLLSRNMPAGSFVVTWDGTNEESSQVANGIYFYRFVAGDFSKTLKMTFMK